MSETKPIDPEILALKQHATGCRICAHALHAHKQDLGQIKVFVELCAEGQRSIRDAPMKEQSVDPVCRHCGTKLERMPNCWRCPVDGDVTGCS